MEKVNLEKLLIGLQGDRKYIEYNWRDVVLYALAVGAGKDDLLYTYEKNLKALPTFGVVPVWNAVNVRPYENVPDSAGMKAYNLLKPEHFPLNMTHEIIMHRPIDPIKGTFQYRDELVDVYDRGEGKGAVVKGEVKVYDEAGRLVCTNITTGYYADLGGFGGKPMPKSEVVMPDRDPDIVVKDHISPVQNVLYRLCGDTNYMHVDPDYAKEVGYDRVFMQGLCSFGFACRMLIGALCPGEPERMTRLGAQMTAIAYPDSNIETRIWKIDEHKAYFSLVDTDQNKAVLNRGIFEY